MTTEMKRVKWRHPLTGKVITAAREDSICWSFISDESLIDPFLWDFLISKAFEVSNDS